MFELCRAMMKEEWRVHTSLFGTSGFILFPLLLTFFAFAGALIWPLFSDVMPGHLVVALTQGSFVLAGASVGAFGLFGREVMNRRFGQASLIAYSSRSLPIRERSILFYFFVKDTIYYFFFWVLPFVAGVTLASPWIGIASSYVPLLLLTLSLSFLMGLSMVFLLSTIYVHSTRLLLMVLLGMIGFAAFLAKVAGAEVIELLPSLAFFYAPSLPLLLFILFLIGVPIAFSVQFLQIEYRETAKRFPPALESLSARYRWSPYAHFLAKDTLDMSRSEGGVGKILFSFLIPVTFLWIALFVLRRFIPPLNTLIVFAILLGVISSTIYNWVTEFDLFTSYTFLPVTVSTVIKAKLQSYVLLNLISIAILLGAGFITGQVSLLLPAFLAFLSVSLYSIAVTVYCTGLSPTVMLYNAKVYVPYLALIAPVLLFLIFISLPNPWYVLSGVIFIPAGGFLLIQGLSRWNTWDQPMY